MPYFVLYDLLYTLFTVIIVGAIRACVRIEFYLLLDDTHCFTINRALCTIVFILSRNDYGVDVNIKSLARRLIVILNRKMR